MSLSDYDYLPKVIEKTARFEPDKPEVISLGTPKSLKLTKENHDEEEGQCSFEETCFTDEHEKLLSTDHSSCLVSSETLSLGILKKSSTKDWDAKYSKNLTMNSTISRNLESNYVRTPLPNSATAFLKPEEKSQFIRDTLDSAALRSAQCVSQERLQRNNDPPPRRNVGAVIPLKGLDRNDTNIGCIGEMLVLLSYILIVCFFPIAIFFCLKVIPEYERAVIFRLGRITRGGAWGPGLCFYVPCLDEMTVVDMRTLSFVVPPQEALTRDSVTVSVDAAVYFRISCPVASVCNVEDVEKSTRLLAQTTLRNIMGTRSLNELLMEREEISNSMHHTLDLATEPWGVVVERVEIKDVRLPVNLQRSMAAEAEATREARAKEIAAEGEKNAAGALKVAADTMMHSPCAIQLRYLQTVTNIASGSGHNSTILFPIPMELLNLKQKMQPQPIYQNVKQDEST